MNRNFTLPRQAMTLWLFVMCIPFFAPAVGSMHAMGSLDINETKQVILVTIENRDQKQYEFLIKQGFDVEKLEMGPLVEDTLDVKDKLNAADLIIIGRGTNSNHYRGDNAIAWHNITTPVMLNNQFIATNGPERIHWYQASSAFHLLDEPEVAYANIADPSDALFTFVNVPGGDSIPWFHAPHSFLELGDTATNGTVHARWGDDVALVVEIPAGEAFDHESAPVLASPRTYFGFGNDSQGWANFFPLSEEAQQVYFNAINRLMDLELKQVIPVQRTLSPPNVVFITTEDRELRQEEFLLAQGFNVEKMNVGALDTASTELIEALNEADLIIIGRAANSGQYRGADAEAWHDITAPVMLNNQFIAVNGPERIHWFQASSGFHSNTYPEVAYAMIPDPDSELFSYVEIDASDSIPWCFPPHSFLELDETATNGNIAARWGDDVALVVEIPAGKAFDDESSPELASPRTYFGFGNDNAGWRNFFPLSPEAQQVYLNSLMRLMDREPTMVVTVEPTQQQFELSVEIHPENAGTVSGAGNYLPDESVTLSAFANQGYIFVNWSIGEDLLSTDATFSYTMPAEDVTITANFEEDDSGVTDGIVRVQYKLGSVSNDGATESYDGNPTEGNLLVVLSGHRFGETDPEITSGDGWTRHIVKATLPNNRIIAMWSKIAEEDDKDVTINWGGNGSRDAWVILQEFSGAEEWLFFDVVSAENVEEGTQLIIGPTEVPEAAGVLAIAATVFRGDVENPVFTNQDMDGLIHYAFTEPQNPAQIVHGSTAFTSTQSGDFAWETTSSWDNDRFASGILALFYTGLGTFTESIPSKQILSIFPNPVQDVLRITSESNMELIAIYNLAGKEVMKMQNVSAMDTELDISALTSGIYMIRVVANNKSISSKFIKIK